MKLFELNWSWYEEYIPYLFVHTDHSKNKEDFERDARSLFPSCAMQVIEDSNSGKHISYIGMKKITEMVAENLPSLGYIRMEPESFGNFGNYIIKRGDSDESKEAIDLLGEVIFKKAVEINEKINRKMDERRENLKKPNIP